MNYHPHHPDYGVWAAFSYTVAPQQLGSFIFSLLCFKEHGQEQKWKMSHMSWNAAQKIYMARLVLLKVWPHAGFSLLNKRGLFLQGFRDNDIENSVPIMHFKQEAKKRGIIEPTEQRVQEWVLVYNAYLTNNEMYQRYRKK